MYCVLDTIGSEIFVQLKQLGAWYGCADVSQLIGREDHIWRLSCGSICENAFSLCCLSFELIAVNRKEIQ